jgi:hypothetical protein
MFAANAVPTRKDNREVWWARDVVGRNLARLSGGPRWGLFREADRQSFHPMDDRRP